MHTTTAGQKNRLLHDFMDFPLSVRIKKITRENAQVRSYLFEYPKRALPGQFVNLWLPGVNERPMSISFDDGTHYTLAIAAVGEMTRALAKTKVGHWIGIRGPYGTHYAWKPRQRIAMIPGGYGAGPTYWLAALAKSCTIDFFHGARSKELLLFASLIKKLKNVRFLPSTDDGSQGFHGFNVQRFEQELAVGERYASVITIGPERMMKSVSDICWKKKIPCQLSIERYMKCGFGICGNCCVDDLGITTCQQGPVVSNEIARKISEFAKYHRDSVGRKHSF